MINLAQEKLLGGRDKVLNFFQGDFHYLVCNVANEVKRVPETLLNDAQQREKWLGLGLATMLRKVSKLPSFGGGARRTCNNSVEH